LDAAVVRVIDSDLGVLFAGTLLLAIQPLLGAARWYLILSRLSTTLPFRSIVRWTYIGTFFSQLLPATVGGDALRVWLASRGGGRLSTSISSVLLDRVSMLFSLVVMIVLSLPWIGALVSADQNLYLAGALLCPFAFGIAVLLAGNAAPKWIKKSRVGHWIGAVAKDTRMLFLDPKSSFTIITFSIVSHANVMASICLFAFAFGANSHFLDTMTLLPLVLLASTVPVSIGGWGTRELAMVTALGTIGIGAETAILSSFWLGLASVIIALPGAFFSTFRSVRRSTTGQSHQLRDDE
jgi:uncharacterized protein (TIRG00374 family)